jgi:hypothetical protein
VQESSSRTFFVAQPAGWGGFQAQVIRQSAKLSVMNRTSKSS